MDIAVNEKRDFETHRLKSAADIVWRKYDGLL